MTSQKKSLPNKPTYEELLSRVAELEAQQGDHELRENEDKYHFLFDNLQETVIIYKVLRDEEGQIVDWILDDCNILAKKILEDRLRRQRGNVSLNFLKKKWFMTILYGHGESMNPEKLTLLKPILNLISDITPLRFFLLQKTFMSM